MKKVTVKVIEFTATWSGKQVTLNTEGLTPSEIKVMVAVRNNNYSDIYADGFGQDWSFGVCESSGLNEKAYRGVASSLIKKGFINIEGKGSEASLSLTEAGRALYGEVAPEVDPTTVEVFAFTGMSLGHFKIVNVNGDFLTVETKKGHLTFNLTDGTQALAVKNPKFANRIKIAGGKATC